MPGLGLGEGRAETAPGRLADQFASRESRVSDDGHVDPGAVFVELRVGRVDSQHDDLSERIGRGEARPFRRLGDGLGDGGAVLAVSQAAAIESSSRALGQARETRRQSRHDPLERRQFPENTTAT